MNSNLKLKGLFQVQKEFLTPAENMEGFIGVGEKKAGLAPQSQLILGILAGAYIAFAARIV